MLAAIWLGVSQAIVIAAFLVVLLVMAVLSEGYRPFDVHPVRGDPTFGFLSGLELRMALPVLGLAVGGGIVLGIVVGSWKLWARRKHVWAVVVSSLPLLLFAVVLLISMVDPDWAS